MHALVILHLLLAQALFSWVIGAQIAGTFNVSSIDIDTRGEDPPQSRHTYTI